MKALIATRETQGWRKNDFCHCNDGGYITFGFECDRESVDGKCGCRRSLVGFDSSRATTTFHATTADLTMDQLRRLLRNKLSREGWISEAHSQEENEKFLGCIFEETVGLWSGFRLVPDGTVIERRGAKFNSRQTVNRPTIN